MGQSLQFLDGETEMVRRIRSHPWSSTPLGPPAGWPQPLKTATNIMLASLQAKFLVWGDERVLIYNDRYAEVLGRKHPEALGQPFFSVWSEIEAEVRPIMDRALAGESIYMDDIQLTLCRHGYAEEAHFNFSYTPLRDEAGQVGGMFCALVETTEQVRVRQSLRDQANRFKLIADAAPAMLWMSNREHQCTFVSRAWQTYTGVPAADGLGFGWIETVHPDERERVRQVYLDATDRREAFALDCRIRTAGGDYRWVIDAGRPLYDIVGRFDGYVGSVIDIHDRKAAEQAMQQSEEKYRTLFNGIDAGFVLLEIVFDEQAQPVDYIFREANPMFEQHTGLTDAIGKTARQLVPDIDAFWFRTYGEVARTGVPVRFENYAPAMDRWFDVYAFRIGPPGNHEVALLFNNISDRKRRELNASFLDDLQARLAGLSLPGRILSVTADAVAEHLGVEAVAFSETDEAFEYTTAIYKREHPQRRLAPARQRLADLFTAPGIEQLAAGRTLVLEDVSEDPRVPPHAQTYLDFDVRSLICAPYRSSNCTFLLMVQRTEPYAWRADEVELVQELSQRVFLRLERARAEESLRRNEQHLRKLSQNLEARVVERTAELEQQALQLRRLAGELASAEHRERKRLAALLHDELQQFLVAAKMRLTTASSRADAATALSLESVAETIEQAVEASRDLTRQLRPPVLYEDGLVPALHWLASEMRKLHGLEVEVQADEAAGELPLGDDVKALLFESVRELLFNVVKHAGVNDARLRLSHADQVFWINVQDRGVGFSPASASAATGGDDGLGLFSIRERLAALGGDLVIDAQPGAGTTIQLVVPYQKDARPPAAAAETAAAQDHIPPAPPTNGDVTLRVVVADDHAIVREGIANVLNSDEQLAVVCEAADGVEAIQAIERHAPDVVLVDVNMPRMNGVEATREIRRRWPGICVIALSVQDDAATARTMLDAGAADFVSKSDPSQRIVATIFKNVHKAADDQRLANREGA